MPLFSRVYIDVPSETHAKFKERAKAQGKAMKVLLAELIEKECSAGSGSQRKRGKSK